MPTLTVLVEQLLAPVPGGTGRVTADLLAAMAADRPDGWRIRAVSSWHRDPAPAVIDGIGRPRRLPVGRRVLAELWARGLPPFLCGDVVLAPTPLFPPRLPTLPGRPRQRRIVIVHDAVPYTHPETLTARGVAWHRTMIRRAKRVDAVVVPARAVAAELAAHVRLPRPTVVGWGVGSELAVPSDAAGRRAALGLPERYLVFVGTVEPRKGLDVALAALTDPALADLPLAVVGPAGWGAGLDELVAAAGIDPGRVLGLGRLPDADLAAVVQGAVALLAPSRSEGFGLPVLEAMAIGVPVVHSDAPVLVELTDGAAVVTGVGDAPALAAALVALARDEPRRAALIAAGRTRAASFSWENSAAEMWRLVTDGTEERDI